MVVLNSSFALVIFLFACVVSEVVGKLCFNDGERVTLPNSCRGYLECKRGRFVVKKCVHGKIFDLVNKECVSSSLSSFGCDRHCTFNDKKHVKGNQKEYVYCEGGLLKAGTCQGYFNRFSKRCERNGEHHLKNIRDQYNYINQWILNSQEKCKPGNKMAVGNSCNKYMECDSNEAWVPAVCPDCQHFQPESMECVWAWKYYCGGSVTTENPVSTSSEEPSSESTSPTEEPTTTTPLTEEPTTDTTPTEEPPTPTTDTTPTEEAPTTTTDEPTTDTTPTEEPTSGTTPTEEPTEGPVTPTEPTSTTTNATTTTTSKSSTTTTTTTKPTTPTPQCTTAGQKKIAEKGDCKDYLECDSGKWVKKSCSFGYDFDINKLDCVWSWWAKC